jgi:hypothetical protein
MVEVECVCNDSKFDYKLGFVGLAWLLYENKIIEGTAYHIQN